MTTTTNIRAPRGTQLRCKGWHQAAALRMIHNNLDPEVAENPDQLVVSGGMGGMGGAQPLAATMNGARFLGIDVDPARIQRRLETAYCDHVAQNLDDALRLLEGAEAVSVALVGNCADVLPELVRRGIVPDVLTDQTSAHDPLNGYVPNEMSLEEARRLRERDPEGYVARSIAAMGVHVDA